VFILLFLFLAPAVGQWLYALAEWFFEFSGMPSLLARAGSSLTRFWSQWL
jgi:hypothetical protein